MLNIHSVRHQKNRKPTKFQYKEKFLFLLDLISDVWEIPVSNLTMCKLWT